MTETIIQSTDDLIAFVEADTACLPGVRLCDNLVTGALRVLMTDGRRFEITAVEVTGDD